MLSCWKVKARTVPGSVHLFLLPSPARPSCSPPLSCVHGDCVVDVADTFVRGAKRCRDCGAWIVLFNFLAAAARGRNEKRRSMARGSTGDYLPFASVLTSEVWRETVITIIESKERGAESNWRLTDSGGRPARAGEGGRYTTPGTATPD